MSRERILDVGESKALVSAVAVGELGGLDDSDQGHVWEKGVEGPIFESDFLVVLRAEELLLFRLEELL